MWKRKKQCEALKDARASKKNELLPASAKISKLYRFQGLFLFSKRYGGLAQLGERLPCKQEVSGSIPLISINMDC